MLSPTCHPPPPTSQQRLKRGWSSSPHALVRAARGALWRDGSQRALGCCYSRGTRHQLEHPARSCSKSSTCTTAEKRRGGPVGCVTGGLRSCWRQLSAPPSFTRVGNANEGRTCKTGLYLRQGALHQREVFSGSWLPPVTLSAACGVQAGGCRTSTSGRLERWCARNGMPRGSAQVSATVRVGSPNPTRCPD